MRFSRLVKTCQVDGMIQVWGNKLNKIYAAF